jgi:hypothetical protein
MAQGSKTITGAAQLRARPGVGTCERTSAATHLKSSTACFSLALHLDRECIQLICCVVTFVMCVHRWCRAPRARPAHGMASAYVSAGGRTCCRTTRTANLHIGWSCLLEQRIAGNCVCWCLMVIILENRLRWFPWTNASSSSSARDSVLTIRHSNMQDYVAPGCLLRAVAEVTSTSCSTNL